MSALVAITLLAAGCNAVFDIGETEPVTTVRDTDGDGLFDGEDNCIDIENPGQEESDGDALGDACDRCPGAPADDNHDEDLDGRPDGCDACPAINDFDDTDADGDGVGDSCDFDSHATERLRFEPFVTLSPAWQGEGMWDVASDDTMGAGAPVSADSKGLALTDVTLSAVEWSIDVGVQSTRAWEIGDRAGFVAQGASGVTTSCTIECATTDCRLTLIVDGAMVQQFALARTPFVELHFEVKEINPTTKLRSYTCSVGTGVVVYGERVPASPSWTPGVVASPTMRVSYLDIRQ